MKGKIRLIIAGLLLAGSLLIASAALAQRPDQVYELSWWTVDGGGGGSSGGYLLDGTAGQPDPGPLLSGGDYQVEGGFWGGELSGSSWYDIYLPLLFKADG